MKEVYVAAALRTPFAAFRGKLGEIEAPRLAATLINAIVDRCRLPGEAVTEVIIGQVLAGGCGQAPARQALRLGGLPDSVHALTVNKVCGSGLKALLLAADSIRLGNSRFVIAGGMESMSLAPYFLKKGRNGYRMGHGELLDLMIYDGLQDPYGGSLMGEIAEASAARSGLTREDLDAYALRSYSYARRALLRKTFADETIAVSRITKGGEESVDVDEEPFRTDLETLPRLRSPFRENGIITAGNASAISDGAALLLLTDEGGLKEFALEPLARLVADATESRHPDHFPEAPEGAIGRVCKKAGIGIEEIDLFEINEAFASVPLQAARTLCLDLEKINVNGGAIAIGHPIGASGARLACTLIHALRRDGLRYGLATLCIGGGEAIAAIFERV